MTHTKQQLEQIIPEIKTCLRDGESIDSLVESLSKSLVETGGEDWALDAIEAEELIIEYRSQAVIEMLHEGVGESLVSWSKEGSVYESHVNLAGLEFKGATKAEGGEGDFSFLESSSSEVRDFMSNLEDFDREIAEEELEELLKFKHETPEN